MELTKAKTAAQAATVTASASSSTVRIGRQLNQHTVMTVFQGAPSRPALAAVLAAASRLSGVGPAAAAHPRQGHSSSREVVRMQRPMQQASQAVAWPLLC